MNVAKLKLYLPFIIVPLILAGIGVEVARQLGSHAPLGFVAMMIFLSGQYFGRYLESSK